MARELDSEMLQRLQTSYREMSNGELVELAGKPDDLTEVALEVLRGEMTHRGLAATPAAGKPSSTGVSREVAKPPAGSVPLMVFNDAIEAGEACDALEDAGLTIELRDVSDKTAAGGSFYGGQPVALQVIVRGVDRARAMEILREKMGLFPLQEVEEADEIVDDGTVTAVGYFGKRSDADEVAHALDEAKIWNRVTANAEGSAEEENAFSVEVKEVDLFEAGDVVEKAMNLPEG